jgi:hypothetical protein
LTVEENPTVARINEDRIKAEEMNNRRDKVLAEERSVYIEIQNILTF